MSSEIITKNDLKAILDTALPTQPVLSDTGWIAPTFTSAFTDYSEDQPVLYRRIGKTVEIVGAAKPTAQLAAGSDTVAFTLPLGFRPSQPVNKIQQGTNYNIWFMYIATNGEVHVSRYRTGSTAEALTTTVWLNMPISFTVENEQWPVIPVTTADYVVEQGTSGIWTYRKWNSGIAECWGKTSIQPVCSRAFGSIYITDTSNPGVSYPFTFITITTEDISTMGNSGNCWLMAEHTNYTPLSQAPAYWVCRPTQASSAMDVNISYYTMGTWK